MIFDKLKAIMESFENKIEKVKFEENPFEDEKVSQEWINSVENEKDMARDREIYPRLDSWVKESNPKTVVEIGAGQGICSDKLTGFQGKYIGVEPSKTLVSRAMELYKNGDRDFIVGNAYKLPLANECCEGAFAINVWFHLENLEQAAAELARILSAKGNFFIVTVNPEEYDEWLGYYEDIKEDGKKIIGKANVPVNPLSRNTFYKHSLEEIKKSLKDNDLEIDNMESFGLGDDSAKVFLSIKGHKK